MAAFIIILQVIQFLSGFGFTESVGKFAANSLLSNNQVFNISLRNGFQTKILSNNKNHGSKKKKLRSYIPYYIFSTFLRSTCPFFQAINHIFLIVFFLHPSPILSCSLFYLFVKTYISKIVSVVLHIKGAICNNVQNISQEKKNLK